MSEQPDDIFICLVRPPPLDPLRLGFPLMMERMYHRAYCKEVLGLPAGPDSTKSQEDPEGYFTRCPDYVTDTRLDPRVIDETGKPIALWKIGKGDPVNMAAETR